MKDVIERVLQDSKIGLVDIGSSGGLEPRWKILSDHLNCFLFEPDDRSFKKMSNSINSGWKVYPTALYSESKEIVLHLCRKPQVSSLYIPNRKFLDLFPHEERWDIVGKASLNAKRLDDVIADLPTRKQCDFIKLDTQGSELSILEGSVETLEYVIGVEVEVEFCQLYLDQPLFGDVCSFLEKQGFSFIDFTRLAKWHRRDCETIRQHLVFADALFLKPPEMIISQLNERLYHNSAEARSKLLRYISICFLYEKIDYIQFIRNNYSEYPYLHELDKDILDSNIKLFTSRSLRSLARQRLRKISRILRRE